MGALVDMKVASRPVLAMADLAVYDHDAAEGQFERTFDLWRRNLSPEAITT